MGKKSEKSGREKPIVQTTEEYHNKTPEPYQCIGNFAVDFTELLRERYSGYQLPVVIKNKKDFSSTGLLVDPSANLQAGKKISKDDKKPAVPQHQTDTEQITQEDKDIIQVLGFKPRTFAIKPTFSALKPALYVDTDNIDKPDNISEISLRRWKVDQGIIEILESCFTAITKLTTIKFWRVGLTSEAISQLAETLSKCETIKFLSIENNQEAKDENYHELIKSDSNLTKLSLRYCNITPIGAKTLADELGTLSYSGNSKLLILDLTGCPLGDFGALHLTKALKINRTLLSLSISNCDIGDIACTEIAKIISCYFLTDEEIFARRQMMSERNMSENAKSVSDIYKHKGPPLSRRGDSKDRPTSVRSASKDEKNKKEKANATKGKKEVKEEKHDKAPPKNKKPEEKASTVKKDITKTVAKSKGGRSARASKAVNQLDNSSETASENMDNIHPLLHKVEPIEPGKLQITGNFNLLLLNLSRNRISEEGLKELSVAISYQSSMMALSKSNRTGLLKLFLQGNQFEDSNDIWGKIQNILSSRDHKAKSVNLEIE